MKRVGRKTLAYRSSFLTSAVAVSLAVVKILKPGAGVDRAGTAEMLDNRRASAANRQASAEQPRDRRLRQHRPQQSQTRWDRKRHLSVMFSLVFGIGLLRTDTPIASAAARIRRLFDWTMRMSNRHKLAPTR